MLCSIRININLMYHTRAQLLRKKLWKTSSKSRTSRLKVVGTSIPAGGSRRWGRPFVNHHAGMDVPTALRRDGLDLLLVLHNFVKTTTQPQHNPTTQFNKSWVWHDYWFAPPTTTTTYHHLPQGTLLSVLEQYRPTLGKLRAWAFSVYTGLC